MVHSVGASVAVHSIYHKVDVVIRGQTLFLAINCSMIRLCTIFSSDVIICASVASSDGNQISVEYLNILRHQNERRRNKRS